MTKYFYAHSLPDKPIEEWQLLEAHLNNVSKLAGEFSKDFKSSSWGKVLGKNHDIGKGTLSWQAYLRHANKVVDELAQFYSGHVKHASAGAQWLFTHSKEAGKLLAYCIKGHHGGLPNWVDSSQNGLKDDLKKGLPRPEFEIGCPDIPQYLPFTGVSGINRNEGRKPTPGGVSALYLL